MNSDQFNPYASTPSSSSPHFGDQSEIAAAVVDQLRRTGGWTRLLSVLLWIVGAFMALIGIMMLIGGGMMNNALGEIGLAAGAGVFYILIALIYIYPAIKLGKYSSACKLLTSQPTEAVLVDALDHQRAFWRYAGMWVTFMICMWVVIVILALGIGAFA